MKTCSSCKLDLPVDQFSAAKHHKDGLSSHCKSCRRSRAKRTYEVVVDSKICGTCGINKPANEYTKLSYSSDGLAGKCKQCAKLLRDPIKVAKYRATCIRGKGRFSSAKGSANTKNIKWDITHGQYDTLIVQNCHYCNGQLNSTGIGLDRKDPLVHYTLTNVVPCCALCNTTKMDNFSYHEMISIIGPAIVEVLKKRSVN